MVASMALPTGPTGHPLLGNAVCLSGGTLRFLQQCAHDYGDLVPLRFFWKKVLFLNHPDYIEQVLVANQRNVVKDIAQRADRPLVGNGLFLSEGDFWLRQRRLMQPAFHRERINAYGQIMVASAERLSASWHEGESRNIYRDMSQLTMGIVARTLFGTDIWDEADTIARALAIALACLGKRVRSVQVLLPDSLPTPTNLRLRHARRQIDTVVDKLIAAHRDGSDDRGDLLSMLLLATSEDGTHMTDRQLRDEVVTILVGGYETAADLLSWAWYLLAQYPTVETKLHAELDGVLAGRSPTVLDLPQLPYTGMVISEVLRLYPPAPALGREATTDFEIAGYPVARGTDILMSQWVMHRDSRYFPDPETFNPDRWGDGLARRLPRYAYFPFGGGPRLCIGSTFATMEATLALATLAQQFRLELATDRPVVAEMLPTVRPKHGLWMVCHRR
jgi:cytochrome P450